MQFDDLLCVNNQTYHREIPAQLGRNGEELPEDESVRQHSRRMLLIVCQLQQSKCSPRDRHRRCASNGKGCNALHVERCLAEGVCRALYIIFLVPNTLHSRMLSPTHMRVCVRDCSSAWGARGFVHLSPWTIKLSIPDPRSRRSNDVPQSTEHKGEL